MFDTNKVASTIKTARTRMNMTQMNLADEMGVSYQAVSNWERGNSMPDISKIPELCKILNISFEELVGERTIETDIVERLIQDENADVTLEEMSKVGHLVKPDKIESKVNETIEKEGKIPFSALVSLAPFMDKETLGKMAEEIADIDLRKLCRIAPFLKRETMDNIVIKSIQMESIDVNSVVAIAPFLSKSTIRKIVEYLIEHGQVKKLVAIAPFMGKEMFPSQLKDIKFDMEEKSKDTACFENTELDDLDEDEVAKLAFEALEQGQDVEEYLDYMDEETVAKLAFRALEVGKDIECYLDYLDEDVIRKLLLQSTRK
ncbi:MAG: helix-turn-helix domain-containing protein [Roseburia sp.]|nr:helix-turn-helix domain-containing protein [Roseburia sp.]